VPVRPCFKQLLPARHQTPPKPTPLSNRTTSPARTSAATAAASPARTSVNNTDPPSLVESRPCRGVSLLLLRAPAVAAVAAAAGCLRELPLTTPFAAAAAASELLRQCSRHSSTMCALPRCPATHVRSRSRHTAAPSSWRCSPRPVCAPVCVRAWRRNASQLSTVDHSAVGGVPPCRLGGHRWSVWGATVAPLCARAHTDWFTAGGD